MGVGIKFPYKRKMRTAKEENDLLKIALSQVNINIFIYNIFSEKIEFIDHNKNHPLGNQKRTVALAELVSEEIVHPDYLDKFKMLFEKIRCGEKAVSATIKVRFLSAWTWQNIILHSCLNKSSKNEVIGTIQDVTNRVESEQKYYKEQRLREAMFATHRVYEVNLTTNRFMKLESIQDTTDTDTWSVYTEAIDNLRNKLVLPEDWEIFSGVSNRENLLAGFQKGQTEFSCEYRIKTENDEVLWASSTTHLLKDPLTGDIKGFIYAEDIDAQKKQELYLREQAEKDPLTGIYNRITAEQLITKILDYTEPEKFYGFLTIDIDNFKQVNDNFGHLAGDCLLKEIAKGFKHTLRSNDICARMGGDEFIIFVNGVNNLKDIIDVAERLCTYVRAIPIGESSFSSSLSIGIAIAPFDGDSFSELYKNSDIALYRVKDAGKDNINMFSKITYKE